MTRPTIILLAVAAAWMVTNAALKAAHDYRPHSVKAASLVMKNILEDNPAGNKNRSAHLRLSYASSFNSHIPGSVQRILNVYDSPKSDHNRYNAREQHKRSTEGRILLGIQVAVIVILFALFLFYFERALQRLSTRERAAAYSDARLSAVCLLAGFIFAGYTAWWQIF
jgi:hypothetical protein